ncbi:MAG: hypothetical protein ACLQUY_27155 [Ktedonobacterales bacterium]
MLPLTNWSNFYVIIGSSAGALTGLTFVVITLIAGRRVEDARQGLNAFTTPIIVHFCAVLVVTALLSAPWTALAPVALLLGLGSLGGLGYATLVVWRLRHVTNYEPEWDDWLWYAVLPCVAYTALLVSAIVLPSHTTSALFGIAAVLVLLLVVGIRDAWDVVTYLAFDQLAQQNTEPDQQASGTERA